MSRVYLFKVVGCNYDSKKEEVYLLSNEQEEALLVGEILGDLAKQSLILRNENGNKRPIDYVEVVSINDGKVVTKF